MNSIFRLLTILILSVSLVTFTVHPAQAQAPAGTNQEKVEETLTGPRKQLATIIFAGLAGAILGLSTLSFYGRPQDHLENIALGFAVGVIGGTTWATYKAATSPEEFYTFDLDEQYTRQAEFSLVNNGLQFKPVTYTWSF